MRSFCPDKCFECDSDYGIVQHHIVPRSKGGKRTIPLCQVCHDKVHGLNPRKISLSLLTKEALAKAKANGIKLGNPRPEEARKLATIKNSELKNEFVKKMLPIIKRFGNMSMRQIAFNLNKQGFKTRQGKLWQCQSVKNILQA